MAEEGRGPDRRDEESDEYGLVDDNALEEFEQELAEELEEGDDAEGIAAEAEVLAEETEAGIEEEAGPRVIGADTEEWRAPEGEAPVADPGQELEEGISDEEDVPGEQDVDEEPTVVAAEAGPAAAGGEPPSGRRGLRAGLRSFRFPLWARFVAASVLIICSVAAATAATALLYVSDIAEAIRHGDKYGKLRADLESVEGGQPQTIMIIGTDKRPEDEELGLKGRSDTTILLRLDPDRDAIALFSIPRDLKVDIPGYGIAKFNDAFAIGGARKTLATVKQLTGLKINHLVSVDYSGFVDAVEAIGCVYVDVDRHYLNKSDFYDKIDIQPGYQALCGIDALRYVRYRHTDNDIVRAARQQDFLRAARQKVPPTRLFTERKELVKIFTRYTTSDIKGTAEMLDVLALMIDARDAPVKEVHFEGTLGPSFVHASQAQIQKAVNEFLGIRGSTGPRGKTAQPVEPQLRAEAQAQKPKIRQKKTKGRGPADLTSAVPFARGLAKNLNRKKKEIGDLTVWYPTLMKSGSVFDQPPRAYKLDPPHRKDDSGPGPGERNAYKWVLVTADLSYYGIMGSKWKDAPILSDPSETREIGDREFKLFYDNDRLRLVSWEDDRGVYWVSNSLIQDLTEREMIEIAKSTKAFGAQAD